MRDATDLTRRALLAAGLASVGGAAAHAQSGWPAGRRLAFDVWRGKRKIGRHVLDFSGSDQDFVVAIDVAMAVSLGPIPLFRYRLQAAETWRGGQFAGLRSHSVTNGKTDQVSAMRTAGGVVVKTLAGTHSLPPAALPLTHWNQRALEGPLFNPQTGLMMRETVTRQSGQMLRRAGAPSIIATRYTLTGEAEITDWYDADGVWTALSAKASDGSHIDYRRTT